MKNLTLSLILFFSVKSIALPYAGKTIICNDTEGDKSGSRITVVVKLNKEINMVDGAVYNGLFGNLELNYRQDITSKKAFRKLMFQKESTEYSNELHARFENDLSRISILPVTDKSWGLDNKMYAIIYDSAFGDMGLQIDYYQTGDGLSADSKRLPVLVCEFAD